MTSENNIGQWSSKLDNLKGFGIVTVVIGHSTLYLQEFIFLFHMPLFFFISGYLFKFRDINSFIVNKVRRLLIPYITFLILLYGFQLFIEDSFEIKKVVFGILGGRYLKGITGVFWFVTCLFFSQIVYNYFQYLRICQIRILVAIFILIAYLNQWFFNCYFPWNINVCLYAIPILHLGREYRIFEGYLSYNLSTVLLFIGLTCVNFLTVIFPDLMLNMKFTNYGIPFFSFFLSIIIIIILFNVFERFNFKILVFLGNASMVIMYLHQFVKLLLVKIYPGVPELVLIIIGLIIPSLIYYLLKSNSVCKKVFLGE